MHIVFDLDGTLANIDHRLHHVRGPGPKNWPEFHAACVQDVAITPMVQLFKSLDYQNHRISIWTGRPESHREETVDWLRLHNMHPSNGLFMRKAGDYRPDTEVKLEWYTAASMKPQLVFEDRTRMVELWRSLGVVCCQVAPGDF